MPTFYIFQNRIFSKQNDKLFKRDDFQSNLNVHSKYQFFHFTYQLVDQIPRKFKWNIHFSILNEHYDRSKIFLDLWKTQKLPLLHTHVNLSPSGWPRVRLARFPQLSVWPGRRGQRARDITSNETVQSRRSSTLPRPSERRQPRLARNEPKTEENSGAFPTLTFRRGGRRGARVIQHRFVFVFLSVGFFRFCFVATAEVDCRRGCVLVLCLADYFRYIIICFVGRFPRLCDSSVCRGCCGTFSDVSQSYGFSMICDQWLCSSDGCTFRYKLCSDDLKVKLWIVKLYFQVVFFKRSVVLYYCCDVDKLVVCHANFHVVAY